MSDHDHDHDHDEHHERDDAAARARATWLRARHALGGALTALEFGEPASAVVVGAGNEPERVIALPLGPGDLARARLGPARPGEAAIEAAIAETEERIMPLRPLLPVGSQCVSRDPRVARIADVLGCASEPWARLDTDLVEQGFNRWVSIALGRPASQDTLPTTPEFGASLLVLREWLHHMGFAGIRIDREAPGN